MRCDLFILIIRWSFVKSCGTGWGKGWVGKKGPFVKNSSLFNIPEINYLCSQKYLTNKNHLLSFGVTWVYKGWFGSATLLICLKISGGAFFFLKKWSWRRQPRKNVASHGFLHIFSMALSKSTLRRQRVFSFICSKICVLICQWGNLGQFSILTPYNSIKMRLSYLKKLI